VPKLDLTGSQAPYAAIANDLLKAIGDGIYSPGDKLPPVATLAPDYGVAPGTIVSALGVLRDRGVTVTRKGTGTFVRDDVDLTNLGNIDQVGSSADLAEILAIVRDIQQRLAVLEQRLPES
jgi:GntR family transcriptional regulator